MPNEFSAYLKRNRERLAMSQEELARYLHVTTSTLQKWEGGKRRPSPLTRAYLEIRLKDAKPAAK